MRILRIILLTLLGAGLLFCCWYGTDVAGAEDAGVTCKRLEVSLRDSSGCRFVTHEDIDELIRKEYGEFYGNRLCELDIDAIEKAVLHHSGVKKAEVYATRDSVLHVTVTPKVPYIRFQKADGGFYCDREGNIFPLQKRFSARVPVVDGCIPVNVPAGFCGPAGSEWERNWISGIIGLEEKILCSRMWKSRISQIHVNGNGDIVLVPVKGRERFIFGGPEEAERKFAQMECYYTSVLPSADSAAYRTVNLKFKDQIICRK